MASATVSVCAGGNAPAEWVPVAGWVNTGVQDDARDGQPPVAEQQGADVAPATQTAPVAEVAQDATMTVEGTVADLPAAPIGEAGQDLRDELRNDSRSPESILQSASTAIPDHLFGPSSKPTPARKKLRTTRR